MSAAQIARRRRRRRSSASSGSSGRRSRTLLVLGGLLLTLAVAGGSAAAGGVLFGLGRYNDFVSGVAPAEDLIAEFSRGGAKIYDRNGALLYEFVDELSGLRRPVPLANISPWLIKATIATEDQSFYENNGLNTRGLARAAWENFSPFGGDPFTGSGGSSITQQLAKNIYIPREERSERTVERKLKEAAIALELTQRYSKDQVLEWYLNTISYSGIYVGIEAAAEGYFGKVASELTLAEAALLAGIPQRPALYNPYENLELARVRQGEVLQLMVSNGDITTQEAELAHAEPLQFRSERFEIQAPHFVLGRVKQEIEARFGERALFDDGLIVVTTLDLTLQKRAEEIIEERVADAEETVEGHNGALFALDPHSGQILVYVGSRDYFRDDIEGRNDNVVSLNSPGSALKPFTYLTAFMQGWSTGTGIIDMPLSIIDPATGEPFRPRNPVKQYQGVIAADRALGNSLNIPAFKTILFGGVQNTVTVLKEVGFTTLDNPLGYGPALTLGGADVTLEDLVYAFSVLAGEGVMRGQDVVTPFDPGERRLEPVALLRVTDVSGDVLYEFTAPRERRAVASNFVYLVTSILSNGDNQCIVYGVCGALSLPGRPSAAKTGTSEPFQYEDEEDQAEGTGAARARREIGDTWTVGYTPELVAGVWAGNADNSPMVNIISSTIAYPAWHDFMVFAHEYLQLPPTEFERPPGVVERELCWPSGRLPSDLCPAANRYSGLFAEDVLPRTPEQLAEMQDSWWQVVRVDTRSGLLATPETPAAFVSQEVRLVLPPDELFMPSEDAETEPGPEDAPLEPELVLWDGYYDWAARNGLTELLAPLEESPPGSSLVQIMVPAAAETVSGALPIIGRAGSPAFERYDVEWGRGPAPQSWVRILTSAEDSPTGVLAVWDTLSVPNGEYAVRVVVHDRERGVLSFAVPVVVDNGEEGADEDSAPLATITSPPGGAVVGGTVLVTGVATSGDVLEVLLQAGAGLTPADWVTVTQSTGPLTGLLANWDTMSFPDGAYALRLTVRDQKLGSTEVTIRVTVRNEPEAGPEGDAADAPGG